MCELTKKLTTNSRVGYKVALRRSNGWFSPATGAFYGHTGKRHRIKPVTDQTRYRQWELDNYFRNVLRLYFNEDLIGRTAVFTKLSDAISLYNMMSDYGEYCPDLRIVKCQVFNGLMSGTYFVNYETGHVEVVAGRCIKVIEDVTNECRPNTEK